MSPLPDDKSIVIIDDSRSSLALLKKFVTDATPNRCIPFDDPTKAVAELAYLNPGLVLVDYEMPGMDGLAFVRWMRGNPDLVDTPVIMITSHGDREILHLALEAGANDFLRKPVDPFELRPRLLNLLKLSAAQWQLRRRADLLASEVMSAAELIRTKENEIILRLARAIEFRDTETGSHIARIAAFSSLIGREVGLTKEECDLLELAAPLHDVGKIAVPDSILLKAGLLTPEERLQMQQHTIQGYDVLKDGSSRVLRMAADIALCHHERWDGTGYPHQRRGEDIPLVARIVAIADVFDALMTKRSYKESWPIDAARDYVVDASGQHSDPACVAAFLRCWPEIEKACGADAPVAAEA